MSSVHFPETGRVSPILELRSGEKTKSFIQSPDKIRRQSPRHYFVAEFVHLVSPSVIYLRLPFHITDKLQVPYTGDLKPAEIKEGKYVMAPIRPDTLGRARIIDKSDLGNDVFIFFIDAGERAIVSKHDLFAIPEELIGHPWQLITVMLNGLDPHDGGEWSPTEVDLLDDIMHRYPYFWVVPKHLAHYPNDNNYHVPVDIYGLTQEEYDDIFTFRKTENIGESIIESFHLYSVVPTPGKLKHDNGSIQQHYPYYNTGQFKRLTEKQLDKDSMVTPLDPSVLFFNIQPFPQLEPDFNKTVKINDNQFLAFIMKSNTAQTPNLFFAYRLDKARNDVPNDPKRFLRFQEEIQAFAYDMNDLYCNIENCYNFNFSDVYAALNQKIRVFGVVHNTATTNLFKSHFQRVEILDCIVTATQAKDRNTPGLPSETELHRIYRVRYIDIGGVELVSMKRVYRIHPKHMQAFPFCYMLSYSNLLPAKPVAGEWPIKAIRFFNDELLPELKAFQVTVFTTKNNDWTKPLCVKTMKRAQNQQSKKAAPEQPEHQPIEERLIREGYAVKDDNYHCDMFADTRYENEEENTEKWMRLNPN